MNKILGMILVLFVVSTVAVEARDRDGGSRDHGRSRGGVSISVSGPLPLPFPAYGTVNFSNRGYYNQGYDRHYRSYCDQSPVIVTRCPDVNYLLAPVAPRVVYVEQQQVQPQIVYVQAPQPQQQVVYVQEQEQQAQQQAVYAPQPQQSATEVQGQMTVVAPPQVEPATTTVTVINTTPYMAYISSIGGNWIANPNGGRVDITYTKREQGEEQVTITTILKDGEKIVEVRPGKPFLLNNKMGTTMNGPTIIIKK